MATPTTPATAAKAVTSGSKVGSIGTVKSLVGSATAVDQNGVKRELQVGDKVFSNDMIQTSAAGIIVIEFVNGQSMDLGRGSQILLNKDIFDPSQAAAEKSDVEAIQAQIAAGADPTQVAEATAAGAGAGDEGGSSFVVVDPSFAQGQVTSGFPTAGIPTPEFQTEEYIGVVEPEAPEAPVITDFIPAGGTTSATVDDEGLEGGITGGTGDFTGVEGNEASFSGTLVFDFGGDGAGSISFASMDGETGAVGTETVTYSWNAATNTLTAAGPRGELFEVVLNPTTGDYTVTLLDNVLHAPGGDENDATAGLTYTVTDSNGSTATGTLNVTFDDDMPTIAAAEEFDSVSATVVEDALSTADGDEGDLSEGNLDDGQTLTDDEASSNVAGSLAGLVTVSDGADEPASVTFGLLEDTGGLPELYSQGELVVYSVEGNILTATAHGDTIFTLTVDEDGGWSFDLDDQLDHVATNSDTTTALVSGAEGEGSVDAIDFSSIVTATVEDADGDTDTLDGLAAGAFTIAVQNDVPTIAAAEEFDSVSATVVEDALSTTFGDTGDNSEGNLDDGQTRDDDEASGSTGSLLGLVTVSVGADEPASVTFGLLTDTSGLPTLYSNDVEVTYEVVGNVLTASAGETVVFTLTVDADGGWSFDLEDQLDHVATNDDTTTALVTDGDPINAIDFSSIVTATVEDADGDTDTLDGLAAGAFTVAVQNDVPVTTNDYNSLTVNSGGVGSTPPGNVLTNDSMGADGSITGGPVTSVTYNGTTYAVPAGGSTMVQGEFGLLTLHSDGSYTYNYNHAEVTVPVDVTPSTPSGATLTAFSEDGSPYSSSGNLILGATDPNASVNVTSGSKAGWGVNDDAGPGTLDYAEELVFQLAEPITNGSFTFQIGNYNSHQSELGDMTWATFDVTGTLISQGTFADIGGSATANGTYTGAPISVGGAVAYIVFSMTDTNGQGYTVTDIHYTYQDYPTGIDNFAYTVTDADGDTSTSNLYITSDQYLQGDGDSNTLTGGSGEDILLGNGGDDILNGGDGDDILVGGDGDDKFVLTDGGGLDSITDFGNGSDVLDISDVLAGAGIVPAADGSDLGSYLSFNYDVGTNQTTVTLNGTVDVVVINGDVNLATLLGSGQIDFAV